MPKPQNGANELPEPICPCCGEDLDIKGICWYCYDRDMGYDPEVREEKRASLERTKAYRGGRWIVDSHMRRGHSEAEAIALAEDPGNLSFGLELFGYSDLVNILADRWATEALRQLILAKDERVLKALSDCPNGGRFFPKKVKRGPKPKGDTGIHIEQEVLRLKREGKTNGQIAKLLGTTRSRVAAAYSNITDKIARYQIADRP